MLTEFQLVYSRKLVLKDLGFEDKSEYYQDRGFLDLKRIEAVYPCEEIFDGKETINVEMFSGEVFTVVSSIDDFNSKLNA